MTKNKITFENYEHKDILHAGGIYRAGPLHDDFMRHFIWIQ